MVRRTLWAACRRRPLGMLTLEERCLRVWYRAASVVCAIRGHRWEEWIHADQSATRTHTDLCARCDCTRDVQE